MDPVLTIIVVVLLVAGLWWFGRWTDRGFKALDDDLEQALRRQEKRLRAQDIEAQRILRQSDEDRD